MGILRTRPSNEILSGESADVYFARAESVLEREGLDPMVVMEVFSREAGVLCGIDEAKNLIAHVLGDADPSEVTVEALDDGDLFEPKEIVLRIRARYRRFGLYETAILGMLAQSTGWASAARECVEAAAPVPVISFGARHVHPDITDVLDYAAIVGGCVGASTPAGARLAGLNPTGTMPHSLVLIFGDTVEAALAFDRDLGPDVPRIVLVDTFKDEAEEALRVAHALGDRLYGIRLDTPAERGRVTADLVTEIRARLDLEGFEHVKIVVSGGLTPDRIRYFKEAGAPVDSFAVGSYISGAAPIDFTGDIKEIDGRPIAKRGRIPGRTASPQAPSIRPRPLARRRLTRAGSGTVRWTIERTPDDRRARPATTASPARRRGPARRPRGRLRAPPARHGPLRAAPLRPGGDRPRPCRPPRARPGLDPRGARPGSLHERPARPRRRDLRAPARGRSRRPTTATTPWARASSGSAGGPRPGPTSSWPWPSRRTAGSTATRWPGSGRPSRERRPARSGRRQDPVGPLHRRLEALAPVELEGRTLRASTASSMSCDAPLPEVGHAPAEELPAEPPAAPLGQQARRARCRRGDGSPPAAARCSGRTRRGEPGHRPGSGRGRRPGRSRGGRGPGGRTTPRPGSATGGRRRRSR